MFVLPNLFTVCSIFCGFYAIILCIGPDDKSDFQAAALSIFVGMLLDLFDGRIARLTKTQSEFGRQLDSLADLISFGTAPAVLLYAWGLHRLGPIGLLCAFAYMACGAMRLARFNVLASQRPPPGHPGPESSDPGGASAPASPVEAPKYSLGLPIPPAAGAVVALVLNVSSPHAVELLAGAAAGITGLGALMVSNVHFRTFKEVRFTGRTLVRIAMAGTALGVIWAWQNAAIGLAAVFAVYVGAGLVEELRWRR